MVWCLNCVSASRYGMVQCESVDVKSSDQGIDEGNSGTVMDWLNYFYLFSKH
jgi:hypothetical protein